MSDRPKFGEKEYHFRSTDGVDVTVYVRENAFADGVISRIPYTEGNFNPKGPFDRTCEHSRERGQTWDECRMEAVYKHMYGLGMEGLIVSAVGETINRSLKSGESHLYVVGSKTAPEVLAYLAADGIPVETIPPSFLQECLQNPPRCKPNLFFLNAYDETGSDWYLPKYLSQRVSQAFTAELKGSTLIMVIPQGVDFGEFFDGVQAHYDGLFDFL